MWVLAQPSEAGQMPRPQSTLRSLAKEPAELSSAVETSFAKVSGWGRQLPVQVSACSASLLGLDSDCWGDFAGNFFARLAGSI